MKYNFKITKESFQEFLISVASEKEYNTLQRLKDKVIDFYKVNRSVEEIVFVPLSTSIDADFKLISLIESENEVNVKFEYLGTSG